MNTNNCVLFLQRNFWIFISETLIVLVSNFVRYSNGVDQVWELDHVGCRTSTDYFFRYNVSFGMKELNFEMEKLDKISQKSDAC